MKKYFYINCFKININVGYMLQNIAHLYIKEAVRYKVMRYLDFRKKLIEVFGEPVMATATLNELSKAS